MISYNGLSCDWNYKTEENNVTPTVCCEIYTENK